jgi:protein TonB
VSYQNIGFAFSLLLHLLFAPFLFYINKPISQESKTFALDFELNSILISGEQDADTETMNISEEVKEEVQEIENVGQEELPPEKVTEVVREEEPKPVEEEQEIERVGEEPPPEKVAEIVKEEEVKPVEEVHEVESVVEEKSAPEKVAEIVQEEEPSPAVEVQEVKRVVEVAPNPVYAKREIKRIIEEKKPEKKDELREIPKSESTLQKVTQSIAIQYIRTNFDNINKLIRLKISYPSRARNKLIEGSVIVAFIVRLDGSIKNIFIKKSSGYSILDNNVIKAVKRAAPFPPPPVEATIIIPITYRLGS